MTDLQTSIQIIAKDNASPAIGRLALNAERGFGKVTHSCKIAALGINNFTLAAAGMGAIIGTFVSSSVRTFNAFDKKIAATGAKARAGAGELALLRAQAKELGATKPFTAAQVAGGQEFLAMAGFATDKIRAVTPAVLDLASATGTDLAVSADIATNILSGFRHEVGQFSKDAEIMAATTTMANTSLTEMGEAMKYVAPVASSTGQDFTQVSGAVGILANNGIKASQSGTYLRAMLQRLASPMRMGAKALSSLGINAADSNGNMRPLLEIMQELGEKTKAMGSADRAGVLRKIFGMEAVSGATVLMKSTKEWKALNDQLERSDGSLTGLTTRMTDNLAGDMEKFNSALSSVKIKLTEDSEGAFRGATQGGTALLGVLNNILTVSPKLGAVLGAGGSLFSGINAIATTLAPIAMTFAGFSMFRNGGVASGASKGLAGAFSKASPMPVYVVGGGIGRGGVGALGGGMEFGGNATGNTGASSAKGANRFSRMGRFLGSVKGAGLISALISGGMLVPTLLDSNISGGDKAKAVGSTAFSIGGSVLGGALGSFLGPLGTIAGATLGGIAGDLIGKMVMDGGLGSSAELKRIKDQSSAFDKEKQNLLTGAKDYIALNGRAAWDSNQKEAFESRLATINQKQTAFLRGKATTEEAKVMHSEEVSAFEAQYGSATASATKESAFYLKQIEKHLNPHNSHTSSTNGMYGGMAPVNDFGGLPWQ